MGETRQKEARDNSVRLSPCPTDPPGANANVLEGTKKAPDRLQLHPTPLHYSSLEQISKHPMVSVFSSAKWGSDVNYVLNWDMGTMPIPNKHPGSVIILKILNIWPENEKSFPCLYIAQHSQEDSRKPLPPVSLPHH